MEEAAPPGVGPKVLFFQVKKFRKSQRTLHLDHIPFRTRRFPKPDSGAGGF